MPDKKGAFTPQELVFIDAYVANGDGIEAAKKAGYHSPHVQKLRKMNNPSMLAAIAEKQEERFYKDLLPAALSCLEELITNKATPAGARVSACKIVIDSTINKDSEAKREKAPHELTADELQHTLNRLRQEAAARATEIIDAVAVEVPPAGDIFE